MLVKVLGLGLILYIIFKDTYQRAGISFRAINIDRTFIEFPRSQTVGTLEPFSCSSLFVSRSFSVLN